ncbi:galactonate dehydratase [Microbacterium sp. NPDC057407]|uniref:galactonate dehydratase n=1 Tax=Microbacterium sp. NPDC057407 TaxID=3346120 RepID=UPI00367011B1
MKITALTTYPVPPRWMFLRIDTDAGISGWGEPIIEGRAATVARAVDEMASHLVGTDPRTVERHWQLLTRGGFYRGGPILASAVAGIDQALWDILGKSLGVPIHQLLGGAVRDRIRIYGWIGGDDPVEVADQAVQMREAGYTAVKMNGTGPQRPIGTAAETEALLHRVGSVREATGSDFDLAIDFHGRTSLPQARRLLQLLEPHHPLFVEEPVAPEYSAHLAAITSTTSIPIATGERLYSRWDFDMVMRAGIAVAQPDVSHAGGISEVRRIAAQAETYNVALAPHCPLGPIALAASLHVGAASPNLLIQEHSLSIHYNDGADMLDYLLDSSVFTHVDGFVAVPSGAGLGIEIDDKQVARMAEIGHDWQTPTWTRDDGSLAEW